MKVFALKCIVEITFYQTESIKNIHLSDDYTSSDNYLVSIIQNDLAGNSMIRPRLKSGSGSLLPETFNVPWLPLKGEGNPIFHLF